MPASVELQSAVAWALACTGHDMDALRPPPGGRAPGWSAGLVLAGRRGWTRVTAAQGRPSRLALLEASPSGPAPLGDEGPQAWHDGVGGLGETSRRAR